MVPAVSLVLVLGHDPDQGFLVGDTPLSSDRVVLARIARRHPCPAVPPRAWTRADPSLARGARCSLVATAAAAVRRPPALDQAAVLDTATHGCVRVRRVTVWDPASDRVVDAYWAVTLVASAAGRIPTVHIDRRTGRVRTEWEWNEYGQSLAALCAPAA